MNFPNYIPQDGDILRGPLAKDRTTHCAVVVKILNNRVYLFPISSDDETYEYYNYIDKAGIVDVPKNLNRKIFTANPKDTSFIYCGKSNLMDFNTREINSMIYNMSLEIFPFKAPEELMEAIGMAINDSRTYSIEERDFLLGCKKS